MFPGGHPSKYWLDSTLLNFSDRTRTGVFNVIWPLAFESGKFTLFQPLTSLQKGELEFENWPQNSIFFQFLSTTAPREKWFKDSGFVTFKCQRPYHVEYTSSRPITEVKQRWVQSVLGWVTAWEHWMLLASLFCPFLLISLHSFDPFLIHFWSIFARLHHLSQVPKRQKTFSLLNKRGRWRPILLPNSDFWGESLMESRVHFSHFVTLGTGTQTQTAGSLWIWERPSLLGNPVVRGWGIKDPEKG